MSAQQQPDRRTAAQAAARVLARLDDGRRPVDPFAIAAKLGILVLGSDKLGGSFSGCLMKSDATFGILYSTAIPNDGFQRFTVSHELGHHQLAAHHAELFRLGEQHFS